MGTSYQGQAQSGQSTPEGHIGTTTPFSAGLIDHSFTLQAIMELQKSTGQLTEAVSALRGSVDKFDKKLDKIEEKVSGVTHKLYAATVVLAILVCIGGFIVNKAWDLMAKQISITGTKEPSPLPKK